MSKTDIFIVEDDGIISADIEFRLKDLGYSVSGTFIYGEEAIEKAEELNPDLVLMDIVLKGEMDGIDAAEIIRSRFGIPVIFLTAHSDEERFDRAKRTNPCGYIIKPFRDRDLKTAIEIALYKSNVDAERRRFNEVLRESEKNYRDLYDNAPDMFLSVDAKTAEILNCNQTLSNNTGYTKEEILGRSIFDMYTLESSEHAKNHVFPLFAKDGIITGEELQVQRKDGSIIDVSLNVLPVRDEKGDIIHSRSIWRDITRQKKLESQIQQLQKMETIATFAGGIAHDFNNILGTIIGCTELSLEDSPIDSILYENLQQVHSAGLRAKDLVQQILTFSRHAEQELKPVRVQTIIEDAIKMSRSMLPSTIEIQKSISSQCGLIIADATQVNQITMNLITNAYHAMQETGGTLKISLGEVDLRGDDLRDAAMSPGSYVCLSVSDTGIGMDKTTLDRIFDPYFTTKGKDKGTGLGLAVVHGLVKKFNGDINVYSEPGKGTTFNVYVPKMQDNAEIKEVECTSPIQKGKEHILFVDDDESLVRTGRLMLERLGYHVTGETNSVDAINSFQADPYKFDLVVTDMTMPNMTGVQVAQKLLEIKPETPIIICTGFNELITKEKAAALGIRGFVLKPMLGAEIAKTIREVLSND